MSDQFIALVSKSVDEYDDSDRCGDWEEDTNHVITGEIFREYMDASSIGEIRRSIGKAIEYLVSNYGKEE